MSHRRPLGTPCVRVIDFDTYEAVGVEAARRQAEEADYLVGPDGAWYLAEDVRQVRSAHPARFRFSCVRVAEPSAEDLTAEAVAGGGNVVRYYPRPRRR